MMKGLASWRISNLQTERRNGQAVITGANGHRLGQLFRMTVWKGLNLMLHQPRSTGTEGTVKDALMNTAITIAGTVIEAGIIRKESIHILIPGPIVIIVVDMMVRGLREDSVKLLHDFLRLVLGRSQIESLLR